MPPNPDAPNDVPRPLQELEKFCRTGEAGLEEFRLAATRRGLHVNEKASWASVRAKLASWLSDNRVMTVFKDAREGDGFGFVETHDESELKDDLAEYGGEDFSAYDDREDILSNLIRVQLDQIQVFSDKEEEDEEKTGEIPGPSNPDSDPVPTVDAVIGLRRENYAVQDADGDDVPLDPEVEEVLGRRLFIIRHLQKQQRPGWKGLTDSQKPILVDAALVGTRVPNEITLEHEPRPEYTTLEGWELVHPFKCFPMDYAHWSTLTEVASREEALGLFKQDPGKRFFRLAGDPEACEIDPDDADSWRGQAVDLEGHIVSGKAAGKPTGDAKATKVEKLLERFGIDPKAKGEERRIGECEVALQLTHEAGVNMAAEAKGKLHPLPPLPHDSLGRGVNPADGTVIPFATPAHLRLTMAKQVGRSSAARSTKIDVDECFSCLACNRQVILEHFADLTEEEITRGEGRYTEQLRRKMAALKKGQVICPIHHVLAIPPFGSMLRCVGDGCEGWMVTPKEVPSTGCGQCSLAYGSSHATDRNLKVAPQKVGTVSLHESAIEEAIYAYLRSVGGDSALEELDRELTDLSLLKMRLHELRQDPSLLEGGPGCRLSVALTPRIVGWIGSAAFGPNMLQIEDGMVTDVQAELPIPNLSKLAKALKRGDYPPPSRVISGSSRERKEKYLKALKRLLAMVALVSGKRLKGDPVEAHEMLEEEVMDPDKSYMYTDVITRNLCQAILESLRNRLVKKAKLPHTSQLFDVEAKHGNAIRLMPHLGCEEVVRAVYLLIERKGVQLALAQLSDDEEDPPRPPAREKKKKKEKAVKGKRDPDKTVKMSELSPAEQAKVKKKQEYVKKEIQEGIEKGLREKEATQSKEREAAEKRKKAKAEKNARKRERKAEEKAQGQDRSAAQKEAEEAEAEKKRKEKESKERRVKKEEKKKQDEGAQGVGGKGIFPKPRSKAQSSSESDDDDEDDSDDEGQLVESFWISDSSEGEALDHHPGKSSGDDSGSETSGRSAAAKVHDNACEDQDLLRKLGASDYIKLVAGEQHGGMLLPLFRKLEHTILQSSDGQKCCPLAQTKMGCSQKEKCCFSHEVIPSHFWSAEWNLFFLLCGGHKGSQGRLPIQSMLTLLGEEQRLTLMNHSDETRREFLLHTLFSQLGNLIQAAGEPLPSREIQDGNRILVRSVVWPEEAPLHLASPSGVPVQKFSRVLVGSVDAVFNVTTLDMGQLLKISESSVVDNMCQMLARGGMISNPPKLRPHLLEWSIPLRLYYQSLKSLQAIPQEVLLSNPGSRLTELFVMTGEADTKGFSDAVWHILDTALLRNEHCFTIGVENESSGVPTYRLSIAHSTAKGEVVYTTKNAHKLERRRFPTKSYNARINATISALPDGLDRHAEGVRLGRHETLKTLLQRLHQIALTGRGKVIISGRGALSRGSLAHQPSRAGHSYETEKVLAVYEKHTQTIQRLEQILPEELHVEQGADPGLEGEPSLTQQLSGDETLKLISMMSAASVSTQKPPEAAAGALPQVETREQRSDRRSQAYQTWKRDIPSSRHWRTNRHFVRAYETHVIPLFQGELPEDEKACVQEQEQALSIQARFLNDWLLTRARAVREPRKAFEDTVKVIRHRFFKSRANEGPDPASVLEAFRGALSPEHLDWLKEVLEHGSDPLYLDLQGGLGYRGKSGDSVKLVEKKLINDHFTEAKALRALVFDIDEPGVERLLKLAGVKISPIVTAHKTDAAGLVRPDRFGEPQLRMCVDCKDGGKPEATNSGIRSQDHTIQKTTSPDQVVHKLLKEEKKFPAHQVSMAKLDIVAAFRQLATVLRRVGLFASEVVGLVAVYLTMIFGAASSPGLFEPLGAVVLQVLQASPRVPFEFEDSPQTCSPEQRQEHLSHVGDTHPQAARFVDDVISMIAQWGDRAHDHMARLKRIIVALFGEGGLNLGKQDEEGQLSNFKHAFGVVIDALDRVARAPWSKIVKVYHIARDFVNGDQLELCYEDITTMRGLLNHVLLCASGMGRMVLPRLDAALADAAQQHPGAPSIPKSFIPNTKLSGESREQGREMLRGKLNLLLRLALIDKGALFSVPLEALLPRHVRQTWPGKETREDQIDYIMDASGKYLFIIDLASGRYVRVKFSEEEQEIFNAFESEHFTDINQRELLSVLFGCLRLSWHYPGKMINNINDNVSAESWTSYSRHSHLRVDHILSTLGLSELLLKQTFYGTRVRTHENFADTGTRDKYEKEFHVGLVELGKKYGWEAKECELESFMRQVGWTAPGRELPEGDWYQLALQFVQYIESQKPGLIERMSKVSVPSVLAALQAAQSGEKFTEELVADGDFGYLGHSEQRELLRNTPSVTRMMLKRRIDKKGVQHVAKQLDVQTQNDPEGLINTIMQAQHAWRYGVLAMDNAAYDIDFRRPESAQEPKPKPYKLPPGHVLTEPIGMSVGYSGQFSWEKSLIHSQLGYVHTTAECNPALIKYGKDILPDSHHCDDVHVFMRPEHRRKVPLAAFSPPCPQHSVANNNRRGNLDSFSGQDFENVGLKLENMRPLLAFVECTPLVKKGEKGHKSPLAKLKANTPSFHHQVLDVRADKTKSDLTGLQARVTHLRVIVMLTLKSCATSPPTNFVVNQSSSPGQFADILDYPEEGKSYRVMPRQDQKMLVFSYRHRPGHAAYTATIDDPEEGRGMLHFPNEVCEPRLGEMPVITSASGSKWIHAALNGSPVCRGVSNAEIARAHCARDLPPEWLHNDSELGQNVLGSMVLQNVSDWLICRAVDWMTAPQEDGHTPLQHWQLHEQAEEYAELAAGKRRAPYQKSSKLDDLVAARTDYVSRAGKKAATYSQYQDMLTHWIEVATAEGWDWCLADVPLQERQRRIIHWMSAEQVLHGIKASTGRKKLSALRWAHVVKLLGNPLEACDGVKDYMRNWQKMDGPEQPKHPTPLPMLKAIRALLTLEQLNDATLHGAYCHGFWFMLRSIEYLADDRGYFDPDRSITWADYVFRDADKKVLSWELAWEFPHRIAEVSVTLYSSKNSLQTCTRTLRQVQGSSVCVVHSLVAIMVAFKKLFGRPPLNRKTSPFQRQCGSVWTREDLSQVLKTAAEAAGLPHARFASHSLRRGGASAYAAAGLPRRDIARLGRWTSDAFERYIYEGAETLNKVLARATHLVPRFERN